MHGSDRTGMMVAAYRIAIQGWSKGRALAEMTDDRFGHHEEFEILRGFIRDLDFQAVMDDVTAYR
jgi:protein tyrosine/serine phosphatase